MDSIKIILVSDNHYHSEPLKVLQEYYKDADYFFHCGDSEMPYKSLAGFARVRGNNDYDSNYPNSLTLEIGEHKFLLVHGHRQLYGFNYEGLVTMAKREGCDIVCFGHTHRYLAIEQDSILLLNPGSIWCNRDGSDPSYMIITLEGKKVKVERKNYSLPLQD